MTVPEALSIRWIMTVHVRLVREFGGSLGVREVGLVDSARLRPLASFGGELVYKTPFTRAGVLWLGLIQNHGFVDGNKRTATATMARWLVVEGYRLRSGRDELVEMAVAIAEKRVEVEQVADWLTHHVTAIAG